MNAETIAELLLGRPFQPFAIHVSDGRSFEVRHPEFAGVSRDHIWVGIPGESPGVAERSHLISLQNITSASPLPAANA
ncbi:MAG: hypothetical protein AAF805_03630 [Planctomycetota bacterium]